MNEDYETMLMELVVNAGDGRSLAIQAIRAARAGNFQEATRLLAECKEAINRCHNTQTSLIQSELQGKTVTINLLMVHAQDHIMNAMTVKDLATEMIEILKERT